MKNSLEFLPNTTTSSHISAQRAVDTPVVTQFQALASDNVVMLNVWTKNGVPKDWYKRNFLGWSFAAIVDGKRSPLRSWVPFEGQRNEKWIPASHDVRPVQGESWFHFDPAPQAQYQVAPVFGTAEDPQVDLELAAVSNVVDVNSVCTEYHSVFSNRMLISSQWLARKAPKDSKGGPLKTWVRQQIGEPENPIRVRLAGNVLPAVKDFFQRAHDIGGKLVGAIYEFTDSEVRSWAIDLAKEKGGKSSRKHSKQDMDRLAIVLSGAGENDAENAETRKMLHEVSDEVWDRFVKQGHIGHNKFWILLDKDGNAISVLTGSTNFTPTGLCGQANFSEIIDDSRVASTYLTYWEHLRDDTVDHDSAQGPDLRAFCHQKFEFEFPDGVKMVLFFSPNTPNTGRGGKLPIDMQYVKDEVLPLIDESILFAYFMPGHPSLIDMFIEEAQKNPNIVVRGVVSSDKSLPDEDVAATLYHRNGEEPVVVPASCFKEDFGDFEKELLSLGFAIVHLKRFVINMFEKNPIVGGDSHNGGERASTYNDENFTIWFGNRPAAMKTGVFILSLYRHYRERYKMMQQKSAFNGFLKTKTADWVDPRKWTPGEPSCRMAALFAGAMEEFDDPAYEVKLMQN